MPEWFKIGARVWFHGFGLETEVVFIDTGELHLDSPEEYGSWIGRDLDGLHSCPLNEVKDHWFPYRID